MIYEHSSGKKSLTLNEGDGKKNEMGTRKEWIDLRCANFSNFFKENIFRFSI